jgi:uncharacterized phage protein (TIGR01671 family)
MREIKFRAWDKKHGKWHGDFYVDIQGWANVFDDDDGGKGGLWEHDITKEFDLVLMQFTGLHDKNGKEIYEGDVVYREILSRDDPALAGRYGDTGAVEECLGVYRVHLVEEWEILSIDINAMSLEVIGNIYENPDLLAEIR